MNKQKNAENDIIEFEEEEFDNLPLNGSALSPKAIIGDSAIPLQGQFDESEYVDDNITRTWTGLLTSFYG